MKIRFTWVILFSFTFHAISAQDDSSHSHIAQPGFALFAELGGKGFLSMNAGFHLHEHHRISIGLTALDYVTQTGSSDTTDSHTWLSPGIMYYYLPGTKKSRLELGAGISISPFPGKDYKPDDSPFSLHAVVGYRYQKKNGFLFRAGFTPFYRPRVWFLPLIGLSLGYSW